LLKRHIRVLAVTVADFRALSDDVISSRRMVGPSTAAEIFAVRDTWSDDELMAVFDLMPSGFTSAIGLPAGWRPPVLAGVAAVCCNWVGEGVVS
jgi:hypothetical protein